MDTDTERQDIINNIYKYIQNSKTYIYEWYVGITDDPTKRLFTDHQVNKESDYWIYRKCSSTYEARSIEEYFINTLKTDGGSGGGNENSVFVYAYHKESYTVEV